MSRSIVSARFFWLHFVCPLSDVVLHNWAHVLGRDHRELTFGVIRKVVIIFGLPLHSSGRKITSLKTTSFGSLLSCGCVLRNFPIQRTRFMDVEGRFFAICLGIHRFLGYLRAVAWGLPATGFEQAGVGSLLYHEVVSVSLGWLQCENFLTSFVE